MNIELLISLFKQIFGEEIEFKVKKVRAQKGSGVIYLPKKYKKKVALVFLESIKEKHENQGTDTSR